MINPVKNKLIFLQLYDSGSGGNISTTLLFQQIKRVYPDCEMITFMKRGDTRRSIIVSLARILRLLRKVGRTRIPSILIATGSLEYALIKSLSRIFNPTSIIVHYVRHNDIYLYRNHPSLGRSRCFPLLTAICLHSYRSSKYCIFNSEWTFQEFKKLVPEDRSGLIKYAIINNGIPDKDLTPPIRRDLLQTKSSIKPISIIVHCRKQPWKGTQFLLDFICNSLCSRYMSTNFVINLIGATEDFLLPVRENLQYVNHGHLDHRSVMILLRKK